MKYWFKRKKYGWGWTPSSKEGWLVTIFFVIAVLASSIYFRNDLEKGDMEAFFIVVGFLTLILVKTCIAKGEDPKWSWGS